jgi:cytochrome c oxidase assembly protein subunit 15
MAILRQGADLSTLPARIMAPAEEMAQERKAVTRMTSLAGVDTGLAETPSRGIGWTRPLRTWLWGGVVLILLMVAVGGATRLTGSGLSITEWRPVTGAIPPLSEADWAAEFARYRAIPQYELVNKGMTLPEFKVIYWWEWGHRQLGRFIGLYFLLGFVWFAFAKRVPARVAAALFGFGLLLAAQGAVGWIMVASGLQPGMTAVAPVKLTLHLMFAAVLLAAVAGFATALDPAPRGPGPVGALARPLAMLLVGLLLVQLALGGLVAGSKSGLSFNTWPLLDGDLIPRFGLLFAATPWWENFLANPPLVQFNHRIGAYLLVLLAIWHAVGLRRTGAGLETVRRAEVLAGLILAQAILGIVTLVLAVPIWAGLSHQILAMVVLIIAARHQVLLGRLWRQA